MNLNGEYFCYTINLCQFFICRYLYLFKMLRLYIYNSVKWISIFLSFYTSFLLAAFTTGAAQDLYLSEVSYKGNKFRTYPYVYDSRPDLPSPFISEENREVILLKIKEKEYTLMDVTQEIGRPFNYNSKIRGKGNQLGVDTLDFPTLAFTGLHASVELTQVQSITGISIAEITYQGRPGKMSGAGFMAEDEDIISVLSGDNQLVERMGLTHCDLSKPFFHLWNTVLYMIDYDNRGIIRSNESDSIFYFGKNIRFAAPNCRGWQYSLFNDSIQGECHLELEVALTEVEKSFINQHYSFLSREEKKDFIEKMTHMHTGEMVAYYIQYYGFYEGHTDYRADPITLAFIFGLKSIEELHDIFEGNLYKQLTLHFPSIFE